jgi:hypothetical protein
MFFTPESFPQPQRFLAFPGAGVMTITNITTFTETVTAKVETQDPVYQKTDVVSFVVKRIFNPVEVCSILADPHITTFDGRKVDAFASGIHTYMRNAQTIIMGEHSGCGTGKKKALCNRQLSLQHNGEYLMFTINEETNKLTMTKGPKEFKYILQASAVMDSPSQVGVL